MSHNAAAFSEPHDQGGQTSKVTLLLLVNGGYVHVVCPYMISFH